MKKRTEQSLFVIMLLAAVWQSAAQQWRQSDFIIGSWQDPCIHQQNDTLNFQVCKNAYFNLLGGGNTQTWQYLNGQREIDYALSIAARVGLKSLVPHEPGACNNAMTFETFQRNANTDNYASSIVQHYKNLGAARVAALQGFWVGHEPSPSPDSFSCGHGDGFTHVIDTIKMWTMAIGTCDPSKLSFALVLPLQNSHDFFTPLLPDGLKDTALYKTYLDDVFNSAVSGSQPQVVGNNIYPLWCHGFDLRYPADTIEKNFFWCLTACRSKAGNRPFWNAVHCIVDSGNLAVPDENNLRWYAFTNVAHGVKGILWFTYWSINHNSGAIGKFGSAIVDCDNTSRRINPEGRTEYTVIREINRYCAYIVGPMVMTSWFVNSYHKAVSGPDAAGNYTVVPGQVYIPSHQILGVSGGADDSILRDLGDSAAMAGVFRDKVDPSVCNILVVNKHWERNTATLINCTVTLKGDCRDSVLLSPRCYGYNGSTVFTRVPVRYSAGFSTVIIPELKGGEGRLIRVMGAGRGTIREGFRPQGGIAAARNDADKRIICFARGRDNRIYARIQDTADNDFWGGQWCRISGLAGTGATGTIVCSNFGADSSVWLFSTNSRGSLIYTRQNFPADKARPLSFSPWRTFVTAEPVGTPIVLSRFGTSKQHLAVFFGSGKKLWYAYGGMAGFTLCQVTAAGVLSGAGPAIGAGYNPGDGSVDVFATDGVTHELSRARMSASRSWTPFARCGITSNGDIAVGTNADGRLEVVVCSGGYLFHSRQNSAGSSAWSSFSRLDTSAHAPEVPDNGAGGLSVAANRDGRLEILTKGSDGFLKHVWQTKANGTWFSGGLLPVGGGPVTIGTGPVCTAGNGGGRISVFIICAGNANIYFTSQCPPGCGTDWQNCLPFTNISDADQ